MFKNIFRKSPAKLRSIGIVYADARREYFATEDAYIAESENFSRVKDIAKLLEKKGFKVRLYPANSSLISAVKKDKPNLIINTADTVRGIDALEPCVPASLEMLNIPYTGTGPLGLTIGINKYLTKKLLELAEIPIPRYQVFLKSESEFEFSFRFPVISKLNECHGSVGITADAISYSEEELRSRLRHLISTYKQGVLVEEFVGKRYENPIMVECIKRAFGVLKMRDYAKFDIRITDDDHFWVIDSNPNTSFGPLEPMTKITELYGVSFNDILDRLLRRNAEEIATVKEEEEQIFADNLKSAKKDVMVMPQVTSII